MHCDAIHRPRSFQYRKQHCCARKASTKQELWSENPHITLNKDINARAISVEIPYLERTITINVHISRTAFLRHAGLLEMPSIPHASFKFQHHAEEEVNVPSSSRQVSAVFVVSVVSTAKKWQESPFHHDIAGNSPPFCSSPRSVHWCWLWWSTPPRHIKIARCPDSKAVLIPVSATGGIQKGSSIKNSGIGISEELRQLDYGKLVPSTMDQILSTWHLR